MRHFEKRGLSSSRYALAGAWLLANLDCGGPRGAADSSAATGASERVPAPVAPAPALPPPPALPAPPPPGPGNEEPAEGGPLPPDRDWNTESPVDAQRATFLLRLPDEQLRLPVERLLRVDTAGARASALLVGSGLPAPAGYRAMAREGSLALVLLSPEGRRYASVSPDDLQFWLLGARSRSGLEVRFRRTENLLVATRGSLTAVLNFGRSARDPQPQACRLLIALALGGDPAAARTACEGVPLPMQLTLRGNDQPALVFERRDAAALRLPRAVLAVPPAEATPGLPLPAHPPEGAFFTPAELAPLSTGRIRGPLSLRSGLHREALVFVDEVAVGWVGPGGHFVVQDLGGIRHYAYLRSLDGIERSLRLDFQLPSEELEAALPETTR